MRRFLFAAAAAATLCWAACPDGALAATGSSEQQPVALAIAAPGYIDTSGEVRDQRAEHQKRLDAFASDLQRDLEGSGKYHIVPISCDAGPCTAGTEASRLQKAAHTAGAKLMLTVSVHKMSTLVQWAKIEITDDEGRTIFERLLTFRGDTDQAWQKAEAFTARQILQALPGLGTNAGSSPLTKIAVFDFELEDFSAAAGLIPASAEDAGQLKRATEEVRRLLAQAEGYSVVEAGRADNASGKAPELRNCNGCEAALAGKLGAAQSLLGIVTRISRTDYAVTFKVRDARTHEVIAAVQTDLRMGASDSWNRGAAWLVKNRLLAKESHQ
jgi:Protein of unknown function (DUF2380)